LIGSRWVDQGTAFCFGQFQEETNEALLIARSEANYQEIILSTAIRSNDVYQRQQGECEELSTICSSVIVLSSDSLFSRSLLNVYFLDTLIVWTEPDGVDYALSFQDPEGCSEVWNFIIEVQRHLNGGGKSNHPVCRIDVGLGKPLIPPEDQGPITSSSPLIGPEQASITPTTILHSGHLPTPQLGIIGEIERAIKALARTQPVKERICEYIQQEVSTPLYHLLQCGVR
jgi:protein phosphatase 4 regulatory subunit 3